MVLWYRYIGEEEYVINAKSLLLNFKYEWSNKKKKLCCTNDYICQFEGLGSQALKLSCRWDCFANFFFRWYLG